MTCANCGASARLDLERGLIVCDYCGTQAIPPVGDDGVQVLVETQFKCPACSAVLSQGRVAEFNLLYCSKCHGMLVAMEDFMALVGALRLYRSAPSTVLGAYRLCHVGPRTVGLRRWSCRDFIGSRDGCSLVLRRSARRHENHQHTGK